MARVHSSGFVVEELRMVTTREDHLFTSESVTEGHPDKVADQISDSILDALIGQDPNSRVACETLVTTGLAFVAGEISTQAYCDIPRVIRGVIQDIGYTDAQFGFDYLTCAVVTSIDEQSPDIAMGVNDSSDHEQGAGDQGMMFGYATDETPEMMPMPITLAHKITMRLAEARRTGELPFLRPDGKSQVTVHYRNGIPVSVNAVVVSTQHSADTSVADIREPIINQVVRKVISSDLLTDETTYYINPTGRFVLGGPQADCGLTGRKIIVDTYGGVGSHGGGAFSGKDPSKVDRSASYMARYIAKNLVAAGLARRCEIQLAYAIGVAQPVSVMVNTDGSGVLSDTDLVDAVRKTFPLTPKGIISHLDLRRPIFRKTAAYGHFGRALPEFTWEKTDKTEELKKFA